MPCHELLRAHQLQASAICRLVQGGVPQPALLLQWLTEASLAHHRQDLRQLNRQLTVYSARVRLSVDSTLPVRRHWIPQTDIIGLQTPTWRLPQSVFTSGYPCSMTPVQTCHGRQHSAPVYMR